MIMGGMKVNIEVKQQIIDGVLQDKRYNLSIDIPYGRGDFRWSKNAFLYDLDRETITDLIPLLTQELNRALSI